MPVDVHIALIVIFYCIMIILSFVQDWIYAKIRLRGYNPILAEVIYFDEVQFVKGSSKVTIVSYKSNGLQRDAVILKAKKDKIGDKIEIVTDGKIAVRKKIALKEDQHFGVGIFALVVMLFFLKSFGPDEELLIAAYFVLIIGLLFTVLHPLVYEAFDSEIKEKLGWRG